MKKFLIAALLAAPLAVSAAGEFKDCSTKASKLTPKTDLAKIAKVSPEEAKKIALGDVAGASIVKGGIETENGCLIYSYHVKDPARTGQTEVFIDAGTGKVLKMENEGKLRAAMEKPVDLVKEGAGVVKEKTTGRPSTNQAAQPK